MRFTKNITSITFSLLLLSCLFVLLQIILPTSVLAAEPDYQALCEKGNAAACLNSGSNGEILGLVVVVINFLAAAVGIAAVIMLVIAGIQYSAAGDNPQAIQAAKQKIYNVLIGLVSFFLLWGFFQWLIPGGFRF